MSMRKIKSQLGIGIVGKNKNIIENLLNKLAIARECISSVEGYVSKDKKLSARLKEILKELEVWRHILSTMK